MFVDVNYPHYVCNSKYIIHFFSVEMTMGWTVITANRLRQGDVVYLTEGAGWTTRLPEAHAVQTPDEERALLAAAEREVAKQEVIGPYAMPVDSSAFGLRPMSRREKIRAQRGPSPLSDTEYRTSQGVDGHVSV
jgi:hypothetical protein